MKINGAQAARVREGLKDFFKNGKLRHKGLPPPALPKPKPKLDPVAEGQKKLVIAAKAIKTRITNAKKELAKYQTKLDASKHPLAKKVYGS